MKNKFTKILSIGLVFAVLASLLVISTPASAGNASWTAALPFPDKPSVSTLSLVNMAVTADGATAFGVTGAGKSIFKSTNGGMVWVPLADNNTAGLTTVDTTIKKVAIAPDDPSLIFILADTNELYASANGGITWGALAVNDVVAASTPTLLNSVTISRDAAGSRTYAVAGTSAAGAGVWYFVTGGGTLPGAGTNVWVDAFAQFAGAVRAGYTALDVEFSPNYTTSDRTFVVLTTSATDTRLNMFNVANQLWNAQYPLFGAEWTNGVNITAGIASANITSATSGSIVLSNTFMALDSNARVAYVALNAANAGLIRTNNNLSATLSVTPMNSVALNAGNDKLVAGAANSNIVYRADNPSSATAVISNSTFKPAGWSTATMTTVAFFGTKVAAANVGAESAFALSEDNGLSFNDVAFVNTVATVNDMAANSDGSKVYLVTKNATSGIVSIWRKTTGWERVFKVASALNYVVRPTLDNFDVLLIAEVNGRNVYFSNDAGQASWAVRFASQNIVDFAAESATTMYVLSGGVVYKSTDSFNWNAPIVPAGAGTGVTLKLVSAGNLIVAGTSGIAYSTDGSTTWTALAIAGGVKYAVANNLATGGVITVASDTAIQKYTIGTSTAFSGLGLPTVVAPFAFNSLVMSGSLTYAMSSNGTASVMYRSPVSALAWSQVPAATNLVDLTAAGGTLKALSTVDNSIWSYTEVFAAAGPAAVAPADRFVVPINEATGFANNVVFQWTPVANSPIGTRYQVQISLDDKFSPPVFGGAVSTPVEFTDPVAIIGQSQTGANFFPFQADTTYYWRVRVSAPVDSPWSTTRSFKINTLSPVNVVSPAIGAMNVSVTPTFAWSPAAGATGYEIVVSDDPTFAIITFSRTTTQPVFATDDEQLAFGTVYYWRVRPTGPTFPAAGTPYVTGVFTTEGRPVETTTPGITITQTNPTITVTVPPPQDVIPPYILWIIIGIGAILVIALIVLIVRTRRVS